MPELYVLKSSENNHDHHQSPTSFNNDRYTPLPYGNSNGQKPEVYSIQAKNHNEPSSSPVNDFHPSSNRTPELHHTKDHDDNIYDRRSSPALINNNRVSPLPYQNSHGKGAEMYYIKVDHDNIRQSPAMDNHNDYQQPIAHGNIRRSPSINNHNDYQTPIVHDTIKHQDGQTITMYLLTTEDGENLPPSHLQRTPSPPIRPTKKQHPITYDIVDDDKKFDVSHKQSPFPTALRDVPTNIRYVPLSQSKASESIQRSMNKYRFGGN